MNSYFDRKLWRFRIMKILFGFGLVIAVFAFPVTILEADSDEDCLCISSEAVQKYCRQENSEVVKDQYKLNQELIAKRDIQKQINHAINADIAKDAEAKSSVETEDFTVKELDGKVYTKEKAAQVGASANNYQGILRVSDKTRITIECLSLKGKEAIVYTNQHFVRYVPDRQDGSPHEVITNIIHKEIWVFTDDGWKVKYVEELERGKTYLDGKLYDVS